MRVAIAQAGRGDLDEVLRLVDLQFDEHAIETDRDRLRTAVAAVLDDDGLGVFLLARESGDAVGLAYMSFVWALEHCGHAAWLEELYVVPEARGRGIGDQLLQTILSCARDRGCAAVDLEVEHSQKRAENLYRRAGFTAHTRSRWVRSLVKR